MQIEKKNLRLNLFLIAVDTGGLIVFFYSLFSIEFNIHILPEYITFFLLTLGAELLPVYLPHDTSISVSFPIVYSAILLVSPVFAAFISFLGDILGTLNSGWRKAFFNGSQFAISAYCSGLVFRFLGGYSFVWSSITFYLAVVSSIIVFFLCNSFLVVAVVSLSSGIPVRTLWKKDINGVLLQYFALFPFSVLLYFIYSGIGFWGLILFFFPLMVARYSFKMYVETKKVHLDLLRALTAAIDAKDPYTRGHSARVSYLSLAIAEKMMLNEKRKEMIEYAAILHDVGKIGIEDAILKKPGPLDAREFHIVKEHSVIGYEIVYKVEFLKEVAGFIRSHHERCNGTGYPDGKKEPEIPLEARILTVADVFDALTSDRPYRKAYSLEEALSIMEEKEKDSFDPRIIQALQAVIKEGGMDAG
ncbi:MAG: HD-GYP domain-containing protein [Candidatus Atribacteria bacterium]|nr:HD-GYP domain-containing protein [Candidatus Atribacteria bacterium]